MFDKGYSFYKVTHQQPGPTDTFLINRMYSFTTDKGNRHLVNVHEYEHKVFIVKFHLLRDKRDAKKYHKVTNHFECAKVLRTVIDICLELLMKDSNASFGFVGVPKISTNQQKTEEEKLPNNQRFRVYKNLSEAFLGTETFLHVEAPISNCYILINKKNQNFNELKDLIPQMFVKTFQDYGLLLAP